MPRPDSDIDFSVAPMSTSIYNLANAAARMAAGIGSIEVEAFGASGERQTVSNVIEAWHLPPALRVTILVNARVGSSPQDQVVAQLNWRDGWPMGCTVLDPRYRGVMFEAVGDLRASARRRMPAQRLYTWYRWLLWAVALVLLIIGWSLNHQLRHVPDTVGASIAVLLGLEWARQRLKLKGDQVPNSSRWNRVKWLDKTAREVWEDRVGWWQRTFLALGGAAVGVSGTILIGIYNHR